MILDVIVFDSHPDDAELSMGGTIAKFTNAGLKVGVIDFTHAEMSTRGTLITRQKESYKAAGILKLDLRENLNMPDGGIKMSDDNVKKVVTVIRKYTPKIIFAPYKNDRHPDHVHTSEVVKEAFFFSGLERYETKDNSIIQKTYRPKKIVYFMQTYSFEPTFIVDISDTFEIKMKAINSYKTQFYNPKSKEPETFISHPNFIKYIEARAVFYGFSIGKNYGEPFYTEEPLDLDLVNYLNKK